MRKKEELEFFGKKIIENYNFQSTDAKVQYPKKNIKFPQGDYLNVSFDQEHLKINFPENVEQYFDSIFNFISEDDKNSAINAIINDVLINVLKKAYLNLEESLRTKKTSEYEIYRKK